MTCFRLRCLGALVAVCLCQADTARAQQPTAVAPAPQPGQSTAKLQSPATQQSTAKQPSDASQQSGGKPQSDAKRPSGDQPAIVREQQPSFFYIPDASGQLRPVINLPLDRLERLLQLDNAAQPEEPPKYSLELHAQGAVTDRQAKLQFDVTVQLLRDDWARVPLRLDEAILLPDSIQYDGPGEHLLAPEAEGRGFVCWLRGRGEKPHHLQLTVQLPTEAIGDESRLRLAMPLANAASLELRVPGTGVLARAPDNAVLETLPAEEATLFKLNVARGPFELNWWRPSGASLAESPALEVNGAILVEIGNRRVQETALLSVRSLERPVERFHVRLPKAAVLINGTGPNYSTVPASDTPGGQNDDAGLVYEVRLDRPSRQADVRIVTECDDIGEEQPVQFAGFEVLEARRQWGDLAVAIDGDWQLIWDKQLNVHRVVEAQLPAELRRQPLTFHFQYVAQPSALSARIVQRQARTLVEPSFVFRVEKQQDVLEARFRWSTAAARVSEVRLNWPDDSWQIDEIGPANLVDAEQLVLTEREPLVIPLDQPLLGDFEITVKAHRPRPADQASTSLAGPIPIADALKPANFVVAAADNVRLTPRVEELVGLTRQPATAVKLSSVGQQEPLGYRADSHQHYFVGDLGVLPRSVAVQSKAEVVWNTGRWLVEQRFFFHIDNEPSSSLSFLLPEAFADNTTVAVTVDGQQLPASARLVRSESGRKSRLTVNLSRERIGPCEVGFSFALAGAPTRKPTNLDVPLVTPLEAKLLHNQVTILPAYGIEVAASSAGWTKATSLGEQNRVAGSLVLESADPRSSLPLTVRFLDMPIVDSLVVERCWIQSWLTDRERQDRSVFRVVTTRSRIEVQLPSGTIQDSVQVFLDGQLVSTRMRNERQVVVFADTQPGVSQRIIEVLYRCRLENPWWGQSLEPARIVDNSATRFCYWQLMLPEHRFLLSTSPGFSAEHAWNWDRYCFARRPPLEQSDLEVWSGARPERMGKLPVNRYLLSTLGTPPNLQAVVLDRSMLVLVSSGGLLMLGLLMIQIPKARHPAVPFALTVALLIALLWETDATILVVQASVAGALLVFLAALLKRLVAVRRAPPAVVRRPPGMLIDRGSSQTHAHLPAIIGSSSSTAASPSFELAQGSKES